MLAIHCNVNSANSLRCFYIFVNAFLHIVCSQAHLLTEHRRKYERKREDKEEKERMDRM